MQKITYLNKSQSAKYLGITRPTFDVWITRYSIPHLKVGEIHLFDTNDLDQFKYLKKWETEINSSAMEEIKSDR